MTDFPTAQGFAALNWRSSWSNLSSQTISGRQQIRSLGQHAWSFKASFHPMIESEKAVIDAFLMKQRGRLNTFTVLVPGKSDVQQTITGTVLVNTAHAVGASTVAIDGWSSGNLLAGDPIKFAGHAKVYRLVEDLATPGNATIEPPLVTALSNNEGVTINNIEYTMRQASDDYDERVSSTTELYTLAVDLVEAI